MIKSIFTQYFLKERRGFQYLGVIVLILTCSAATHGKSVLHALSAPEGETTVFIIYNEQNIHSIQDCFTKPPYYPGLYRPLTTSCYYYFGRNLFGRQIIPYKIFNMFIYLANAFLLFLVCRQFLPFGWSLLPVAFFCTRKLHTYMLFGTVEFQSLLSIFFCLLTFYFFIRSRGEDRTLFECLSYGFFLLALLSKETAVAIVAVLVLHGWLYDTRIKLRPYIIHIALAAAWAYFYFAVFRGSAGYETLQFSYSLAPQDLLNNFNTYLLSFFNFLIPRPDHFTAPTFSGETMAAINSPFAQAILLSAIILAGVIVLFNKKANFKRHTNIRLLAFGFALFLILMSPYVVVQNRLLLRYSYAGHLGISIFAGVFCAISITFIWKKLAILKRARPS